jgi:hypothetical protein
VTCKARLEFLRLTAPGLLEQGVNYCLVDYDCPQQSGDWLQGFAKKASIPGEVLVVNYRPAPRFHKTHALNMGARAAIEHGATHLIFTDADTIHSSGSIEATLGLLEPSEFVIAGRCVEDRTIPSLTGFLAVSSHDFGMAQGYDENFCGWGAEDLELRLRLHLEHRLVFRELPRQYLSAISHSDALRVAFQDGLDMDTSHQRNLKILRAKTMQWTGCELLDLAPPAARLLCSRKDDRESALSIGA